MLKSVASILLFVKDPHQSAEFYQELGFIPVSEDGSSAVVRMNWFKIWFQDEKQAKYTKDSGMKPKGTGVFIYLSVDDIDQYHKTLVEKGLKPSSEPSDQPWGNREFAIKDPDGYKLIMHQPL